MSKYPISKEFGFYANFTPPIRGPKMAGWMGSLMKPPKWFHTDDKMTVTKKRIPGEDCYAALLWAIENAESLGVSKEKIAVGGDSAGGCLAAAVSMMARDHIGFKPRFQLLVYPYTDQRMESVSNRRFTDTPMWNSRLSKIMLRGYITDEVADIAYASPIEADNHSDLPTAYIETAEFDCLHDDGIGYAQKLRNAGVVVEVNETKGTMHGFDIAQDAPTTQAAIKKRIDFMRRYWEDAE